MEEMSRFRNEVWLAGQKLDKREGNTKNDSYKSDKTHKPYKRQLSRKGPVTSAFKLEVPIKLPPSLPPRPGLDRTKYCKYHLTQTNHYGNLRTRIPFFGLCHQNHERRRERKHKGSSSLPLCFEEHIIESTLQDSVLDLALLGPFVALLAHRNLASTRFQGTNDNEARSSNRHINDPVHDYHPCR
ncbi:hypothetical protein JHK87_053199 [Glycine soja]|nr:hypothetical protein JHK87_053199 [Glycine soja]